MFVITTVTNTMNESVYIFANDFWETFEFVD